MRMFLLVAVAAQACWAQASSPHLNRLFEHWRWMQYWQGATELDSKYQAGAEIPLLLFWPKDPADPGLGFCSSALHVCQFYANSSGDFARSRMEMFAREEARQAFSRFVEEVLRPAAAAPKPKESDYATELVTTVLPALDPPAGVRERKPAERARIESLAAQFGCRVISPDPRSPDSGVPDCKYHLLIPFFGDSDMWVPVYSACARECESTDAPSITFFQWIKGAWWRGVTTSTKAPNDVARIRRRIEDALLTEGGR